MNEGKVIQVAGPAVDVEFLEGHIPVIRTAIRIISEGFNVPDPIDIICEVAQHIGESRVRTIALQPTEGLVRGMKAVSLGQPVMVPVGRETLGRILNSPIAVPAPVVQEDRNKLQIFETGIRVIDLPEPYLKGGKIGLFGGAG